LHQGAFVWADSQNAVFASTANDQFCIRAQGGIQIQNSASMSFGNQTRQMINLFKAGTTYGIGVQNAREYFRTDANSGFAWFSGGTHNDNTDNAGGGTELMVLTSSGLTVNGTFVSVSDRHAKMNFKQVSAPEILQKVDSLPISQWNYKQDPGVEHIGPMAQDFYAAFSVGLDDKHIAVVDEGGVALAAIQGLNQKLTEEIKRRDVEDAKLRQRLEKLERMMSLNH
jgi:hypothetical protein